MVNRPWDYQWQTTSFHCGIIDLNVLVRKDELLSDIDTRKDFLNNENKCTNLLEEKNRIDCPFGSDDFYTLVESLTGIDTRPRAPLGHLKNSNVSPELFLIMPGLISVMKLRTI